MNSKPCGTTTAPPHPPTSLPWGHCTPRFFFSHYTCPWKRSVLFTGVAQGRNSDSHQAKIKEKTIPRSKWLFFVFLISWFFAFTKSQTDSRGCSFTSIMWSKTCAASWLNQFPVLSVCEPPISELCWFHQPQKS